MSFNYASLTVRLTYGHCAMCSIIETAKLFIKCNIWQPDLMGLLRVLEHEAGLLHALRRLTDHLLCH